MEKGGVIGIVIVLIVLVIAFVFIFNNQDNSEGIVVSDSLEKVSEQENIQEETTDGEPEPEITEETTSKEHIVEITSSGFSPKTLTISEGDKVTWLNKGSTNSWPASNNHPTHTVYPESGGCIGSKFDACKGLSNGETYSFTFNEVGTWGYHDHLISSKQGTMVVN